MVNGGFPPIKLKEIKKIEVNSKERLFSNSVKKNIDIRQILTENIQRKSIIDINDKNDDELEVLDKI